MDAAGAGGLVCGEAGGSAEEAECEGRGQDALYAEPAQFGGADETELGKDACGGAGVGGWAGDWCNGPCFCYGFVQV